MKNEKTMSKNKGFTLLELLMVLIVTVVVGTYVYKQAMSYYVRYTSKAQLAEFLDNMRTEGELYIGSSLSSCDANQWYPVAEKFIYDGADEWNGGDSSLAENSSHIIYGAHIGYRTKDNKVYTLNEIKNDHSKITIVTKMEIEIIISGVYAQYADYYAKELHGQFKPNQSGNVLGYLVFEYPLAHDFIRNAESSLRQCWKNPTNPNDEVNFRR